MKILFASAEVDPFAKVGGLADVAAALPARLREMGHDVRVVTPCHASSRPAFDSAVARPEALSAAPDTLDVCVARALALPPPCGTSF